jgi:hypothetical protein
MCAPPLHLRFAQSAGCYLCRVLTRQGAASPPARVHADLSLQACGRSVSLNRTRGTTATGGFAVPGCEPGRPVQLTGSWWICAVSIDRPAQCFADGHPPDWRPAHRQHGAGHDDRQARHDAPHRCACACLPVTLLELTHSFSRVAGSLRVRRSCIACKLATLTSRQPAIQQLAVKRPV